MTSREMRHRERQITETISDTLKTRPGITGVHGPTEYRDFAIIEADDGTKFVVSVMTLNH